jgi:hypothetical protein
MRQPTTFATPAPPATPQAGSGLGEAIKKTVDDALAGALAPARAQMQEELARLMARRDAMSSALQSTNPRLPARLAMQRQIADLDREIADLQRGIEKLNARLTTRDGPGTFASTAPPPAFPNRPMNNFDPTPMVISVLGILFVAFPLTLAVVRFLWRRASNAPAPAITAEQTRRFDRLEQSVDAIAIEVERISENQRYLTRLLAEPKKEGLGAGG